MKKDLSGAGEGRIPENIPVSKQESESSQKNFSVFDLLKGKLTFSDERPWVKIVIIVLTMLFLLAIIHELKGIGFAALIVNKIIDLKWSGLSNIFKGQ